MFYMIFFPYKIKQSYASEPCHAKVYQKSIRFQGAEEEKNEHTYPSRVMEKLITAGIAENQSITNKDHNVNDLLSWLY